MTQQVQEYFDSDELCMLCAADDIFTQIAETKRLLIIASKAKKINTPAVEKATNMLRTLDEAVYELNKSSCYIFYRKYQFFRPGIRSYSFTN